MALTFVGGNNEKLQLPVTNILFDKGCYVTYNTSGSFSLIVNAGVPIGGAIILSSSSAYPLKSENAVETVTFIPKPGEGVLQVNSVIEFTKPAKYITISLIVPPYNPVTINSLMLNIPPPGSESNSKNTIYVLALLLIIGAIVFFIKKNKK